MSKKIRNNPLGINLNRRNFLKGTGLGLAASALPAAKTEASFLDVFFQKHFQEIDLIFRIPHGD